MTKWSRKLDRRRGSPGVGGIEIVPSRWPLFADPNSLESCGKRRLVDSSSLPFRNRSIISSKVERFFHRVAAPPSPPCTHVFIDAITDGREITFCLDFNAIYSVQFLELERKRKVSGSSRAQSPSFFFFFEIFDNGEIFVREKCLECIERMHETALDGMENATNRGATNEIKRKLGLLSSARKAHCT